MSDLTDEELKALKNFARFWTRVQSWCLINRWIALTVIAILIAISQGLEAIKNIIAWRP